MQKKRQLYQEELFAPVIMDTWLQFEGKEQGVDHCPWKTLAHLGVAPCDPSWRASVLENTARINRQTLDGLLVW